MKVLIADDEPASRALVQNVLANVEGIDLITVDNGDHAWLVIQEHGGPLLALLDWVMPGLQGPQICRLAKERLGTNAYLILATSRDNKDDIVAGLEEGADDYIAKPIHARELRARVKAGIRTLELQNLLQEKIADLECALNQVKTLQGLLPICANCKKIRNDKGYWQQIEDYLSQHTEAEFSHGICPDCAKKLYPELADSSL